MVAREYQRLAALDQGEALRRLAEAGETLARFGRLIATDEQRQA